MAEISDEGTIGTYELKNITGITKYSDDKIFVSAKGSTKTLSSYALDDLNNISSSPTYSTLFLGKDIRSITTYKNYLVIVSKTNDFKISLVNPTTRSQVGLKVWNSDTKTAEDVIDYATVPILSITTACTRSCLKVITTIILESKIFMFVQSNCTHNKGNILYILSSGFDEDNLRIKDSFELETFFNLYKNGKLNNLSKELAKTVVVNSVAYNSDRNIFTLLHVYGKRQKGTNGYITNLEKYDYFSSLGSSLAILDLDLKKKPRGITYLGNNKYAIITNYTTVGSGSKLTKYQIVSLS
jgi:hypothetical protein